MKKRPLNLYLDEKLIKDFEKTIQPYHKSNVITELISDYLELKKDARDNQSLAHVKTTKTTNQGRSSNVS